MEKMQRCIKTKEGTVFLEYKVIVEKVSCERKREKESDY